uniref:aminotransferase-like domain-containing protein n=1 Tax=Castellaniella defragrans TaxID=75697 RepID=UPI0033402DBA
MVTANTRTSPGQTERVIQAIRQGIAARELVPGARLPSLRAMASNLQVSKSTVVEAYDRLAADGTIRPRPGSGFYVTGHLAPLTLADIGPRLDREVDPLWVSRQSLETGTRSLKPGCGWLPAEWMPQDAVRRALRAAARAPGTALSDYASPLGLPGLRQRLAQRLRERGTDTRPQQILLTDSGTQAVDLLCRFLIKPGDTILVDDPCYFNFLALLRAHQVRVVSVPHTPDGPDLAQFAQALAEHSPRLYLTNSGPHNPTGATLSPITTHRLLKLAQAHDLVIVEDDIFADFETTPTARLAAFDGLDRVIQVGSFSKTLSASARCGYIAARPDWIDALADLRIATAFSGSGLSQALVLSMLGDGTYRRQTESLRLRLAQSMHQAAEILGRLGISPWLLPRDGMFLWCQLPDGVDATTMARQALDKGLVLAPGNVFSLTQSAGRMMRFNVSQMSDPRLPALLDQALTRAATMPEAPPHADSTTAHATRP